MNSAVAAPKLCTTCGARYAADALFCPADGTPLTSAGAAARGGSDPGGDPYLGRELSGHIEIRQLAGVGAMGRVYRAFQKGIDRDVAVKVLHRELSANAQLVARFHREAKVASRLQHPNVVQVHLAGQLPDGALYIVMEYLDGLSLQSALAAAGGGMPLPRALHIAFQLCDASGEAHAQGIVHRDLKPENVMLVNRGDDPDYVKVLDFGIARLNWGEQSMATAAGLIFGTARYISPEGAQGETVGPAGDVYSIATLIFQMLAGRTPFEGEQAVGLLVQQIHDAPPPLRSIARAAYVPEPIAQVVMKNLAKDPQKRDPDARTLGRALMEAAKASGLSPDDFVRRSVLLGPRAAMQLPAMQRTKQLQLEKPFAEMLSGPNAGPPSPASPASPASPEPRDLPSHIAMQRPSAVTVAVAPVDLSNVQNAPNAPNAPSASTQRWVPPPDFRAKLGTPPPSNVDITLDDASAPLGPVLPDAGRSPASTHAMPTQHAYPVPSPGPTAPPTAARDDAARGGSKPSSNVDRTLGEGEEEAQGLPRRGRLRWIGVVFLCFLLGIGITTALAYKLNFIGSSASRASVEDQIARATDALRHKRWDAPPGDNVRDLTNDGLARWPNDQRLLDVRARATDELVKEALGRKFAGDVTEALHLARLARELDPADTTAQHLVEQYEAETRAAQGPILVLPSVDAGTVVPSGRAPVTATGPFRAAMDVSPAKPRVGQAVDLVVKVTTSSGAVPKKPLDDALFQISGAAMGALGVAKLPALADGNGIFRASFTFLAPGKYDIAFNAKADGLVIKTSRVLVAEEAPQAPSAPPDTSAPAPGASVKWL